MMLYALPPLCIVIGSGLAAPAPVPVAVPAATAADCPQPAVSSSQTFTLVSKVIKSSLGLDVENWSVTGVHDGAGQNALVLTNADPLGKDAGRLYMNGTTDNTTSSVGMNNVMADGTGTLGYGVRLDKNVTGDVWIASLDIGNGTDGIGITTDKDGIPYFVGNGQNDGQFFACNTTIYGSDDVPALFWRNGTTQLPNGCADIELVPQCTGNTSNETVYTQQLVPSTCLVNATAYQPPS